MQDIVHWNYVTSQNIPRFDKALKILSIHVVATYIFVRPIFTPRKLISGIAEWPRSDFCPWQFGIGNCNYRRLNKVMGKSHGMDNDHLKESKHEINWWKLKLSYPCEGLGCSFIFTIHTIRHRLGIRGFVLANCFLFWIEYGVFWAIFL